MASWLDGFYDNSWLKLVRYNSTLNKFQAGNIAIPNVRAVDDWAALQAIPKTSANDELIVHVRDQPANKSMWIYKHSLGRWKIIDTTFGPHAKSIMWIGDYSSILTGNTTLGVNYLQDTRVPYYGESVSMPTINATGTYMRSYRFNRGCSKASGGSIQFTKASRTLRWKAPGDTGGPLGDGYGAAITVSTPGWYRLESATSGMDMVCSIFPSNEPAADATDAVTLAALTNPFISMHGLGSAIGHFNAMYGNPFKEKQYPFLATFMTTIDLKNSYANWQDIDSDITLIWFGLTGKVSVADTNTNLGYLQEVVQRRKDRGSHVIVMTVLEANGFSDDSTRWNLHANQRLMELASSIGFELIDVNSVLRDPSGTLSNPLTTTYLSTDQLTLSSKGAYMVAKYVLYPALSKYLPSITQKSNPVVPYSASDNFGNLLTNGKFTGLTGTKGTGFNAATELADSWTCSRTTGSTLTIDGNMPDGASPIARTDGYPGKWVRFVISNNNLSNAAGEAVTLTQTSNVSTSNYTSGDVVQFTGTLRVSAANAGGGAGIRAMNLRVTTDKGNSIVLGDNSITTNYILGNYNGEDVTYNLVSMPMIIASGTTILNVILTITFEAGGAATIDLGQDWMLRKIV